MVLHIDQSNHFQTVSQQMFHTHLIMTPPPHEMMRQIFSSVVCLSISPAVCLFICLSRCRVRSTSLSRYNNSRLNIVWLYYIVRVLSITLEGLMAFWNDLAQLKIKMFKQKYNQLCFVCLLKRNFQVISRRSVHLPAFPDTAVLAFLIRKKLSVPSQEPS